MSFLKDLLHFASGMSRCSRRTDEVARRRISLTLVIFRFNNISVKSFFGRVIHCSEVFSKEEEVEMEKMHFEAHSTSHTYVGLQQFLDTILAIIRAFFSRKPLQTDLKTSHVLRLSDLLARKCWKAAQDLSCRDNSAQPTSAIPE